ncbi:MAG: hypothetical protein PHE06_04650 [Lachnospiraceae bacterium]|nr:hypothetical protein [Lachnospiraceae bacterium]MDD3795253.1 hypothetical protein [Lachnospiraceae bacterium]
MSRIDNIIDTHVYYSILKAEKKIFADERDKWKFLNILFQLYGENHFSVYAFSVLDDEMHILWKGKEQEQSGVLDQLVKKYKSYYGKMYRITEDAVKIEMTFSEISNLSQIPSICREIHYLPIRYGYAGELNDYWWSSFQTYRQAYRWPGIEESAVLRYFDDNPEEGYRRFVKFHRKALPDKKTMQV